jgi:hypothetical protein
LNISSKIKKAAVIISCTLLLAACDTAYQPMAWDGGYEDKSLGDKHFWLKYQGNSTTDDQWVKESWQRRASELCPTGFKIFKLMGIAKSAQRETDLNKIIFKKRNPIIEGEIKCQ